MSGIAGIVMRNQGTRPQLGAATKRMLGALTVKGPDAQAQWQEGPVSLGATVFRSMPEQRNEVGPTHLAHVVIVADARLDEREGVLDSLGIPRSEHASISDAELIAHAYLQWGKECVRRLNGDFSFAIWDRKEQSLFCARDLFAVRPFYYAEMADGLIFASSFDAFRASELFQLQPDPVRIYDALTYKWLEFGEPERSFFREVMRLRAGHVLSYANGRLRSTRYALLKPSLQTLPRDTRELPIAFRECFERAVARRLRRSGPLASMLSGGLDSGAIVCASRELMRRRGEGPLITCSVLSDPPYDQETPYVRAVQEGGHLICQDLTMAQMPEFTEEMLRYLQQSATAPLDWTCSHLWLACAVATKRAGSRIMLTGEAGDFALGVSCDPTQRALREGALWDAYDLPRQQARIGKWTTQDVLNIWLASTFQYVQRDVVRWISPSLYWNRRVRRHRVIRARQHRECLNPPPPQLEEEMLVRFSRTRLTDEWPVRDREDHLFAHGVDNFLGGVGEMWDRICSAQGIEARHPMLDRELIEFCMAVPWRERMAGGRTKALLRQCGILPVGHTTQLGEVLPNANSSARYAMCRPIAPWLGERLERSQAAEAWFSPTYLRKLREDLRAGRRDGPLLDDVLEAVVLSDWLGRGLS